MSIQQNTVCNLINSVDCDEINFDKKQVYLSYLNVNLQSLCSIGRTKTKSGRAETDKSKLNRKRVIELYRVEVTDGTTTLDMATYQTEVTVTANAPDADMYFDKWEVTGLDTTGMDLTKTEIKFQMPVGNVSFKATYLSVAKYDIVIVDGTKDISPAKAGETITITAKGAPTGKVFDKWTCETAGVTIEFASATSAKTTFVIPACEIEIKAHFRYVGDAPSVEIKVNGGTGAGVVKKGEIITVTANEPAEGKVFKGWKDASGEIVSTVKSYTFEVTEGRTLTAEYDDLSSGERFRYLDGYGSGKLFIRPFVNVQIVTESIEHFGNHIFCKFKRNLLRFSAEH